MIDDFTFDDSEKEVGKEHGTAYSTRFSYTPIKSEKSILTTYLSFLYVGTPTFRHGLGTNNFVHRGFPLGWQYGSDGTELSLGLNYYNRSSLFYPWM